MSFEYPVAVENSRSRRVAEGLGGILAGRACCASRVVALHPGALARYAEKIGRIHDAVVTGTAFDDREFAEALCELVESVIVRPGYGQGRIEVEITGRLTLREEAFSNGGRALEDRLVAGAGLEPATSGL